MRTDVTRQSFGFIAVQFVVLAGLFWISSFYAGSGSESILPGFSNPPWSTDTVNTTLLPGNFIGRFASGYPTMTATVSLVILFINAFLITKTVTRNLVYSVRTYLPCIFYLLIACGLCFPAYDLPAVLAAYLMVRATTAFISSFVRTASFGTTCKAAFFIGLTPLLEPQNAIYILLVPIAMLVFRRGGRETVVAVFGSLLPTFITGYVWWACGGTFSGIFIEIWRELSAGAGDLFGGAYTPWAGLREANEGSPAIVIKFIGLVIITVTVILSIFSFFRMSSDMRTRAYKINVFALWFLVVGIVSIMLPSRSCGNFPVIAIPASIIAPAFFIKQRNIIPLVLYILIIATITVANLLPIAAIQ